jgi:hypothetical protein
LHFNSPQDRVVFATTEQFMYRQFFKKTLFHEATHKQESQASTIAHSEMYVDILSAMLETSERGELFELTMFGSISSHNNHGFAAFQAFELGQQKGAEQRRQWRESNLDNLKTRFILLYGPRLR